jgi:hypothetical protein
LNLLADTGIVDTITLSCTKITYKTPWAKVAKGLEELNLSTVYCFFDPSSLVPTPKNTIRVVISQTGYTRPGIYSVGIIAQDKSGKLSTTKWLTLIVASNSFSKQSTVLQEVFTAHWCEPCVLQREAGYRIFCEYGPRYIMPVAYHVMDDADIEVTGMTRPENFERFKLYGGIGVPQVVNNGEEMKLLSNSKQLAHDRISGRKYSGTTNDYYKMRGDLDSLTKLQDYQMNVFGDINEESGHVFIEAPGYDFENNTENELVVLLTEDDIEYNATNGEDYHHFVVRLIATKYITSDEKQKSFYKMNFSIPKMPDGFGIKKENTRIVAFIQKKDNRKIQACGWYKLNNPLFGKPLVFTAIKNPTVSRNALVPLNIFISNLTSLWKTFNVSLEAGFGVLVTTETKTLTIGSGATTQMTLKIDTTGITDEISTIPIKISLEDDFDNTQVNAFVIEVVSK